jgi:hypothetical protein
MVLGQALKTIQGGLFVKILATIVFSVSTALVFGLAVRSAPATAGYHTPNMTCAQTQNLVQSQGSVLLYFGNDLYDVVVAHKGYCYRDECAYATHAPTQDNGACFVGYICDPCRNR